MMYVWRSTIWLLFLEMGCFVIVGQLDNGVDWWIGIMVGYDIVGLSSYWSRIMMMVLTDFFSF